MANGVNKTIHIGNLTSDPETKALPSGSTVAEFSIACNRSWTDKQSGQKKEEAEFVRITAFGRQAEVCGQYLRKGSQVYIEGRLKTDKWQDQQGNTRYTTKVVMENMQMLGSKSSGGNQQQPQQQPAQAWPQVPADFEEIPF